MRASLAKLSRSCFVFKVKSIYCTMEEQQFVVKSSILLFIKGKTRTIELCLGDISKLGLRNKVDILLISAFPDGYDASAGTVIEALKTNVKLSVGDLAKSKAVDKRATHKCWWSKLLQRADVPFDRLLCYESGGGIAAAAEFTNTAFSCLTSIFKDQSFKMASSLLNTGQQKMDEVVMLEAIVEAAVTAMKNGLNLDQFMVFVHTEYKGEAEFEPKVHNYEGIVAKFEALKAKYLSE